jgi:hypothetical protein
MVMTAAAAVSTTAVVLSTRSSTVQYIHTGTT